MYGCLVGILFVHCVVWNPSPDCHSTQSKPSPIVGPSPDHPGDSLLSIKPLLPTHENTPSDWRSLRPTNIRGHSSSAQGNSCETQFISWLVVRVTSVPFSSKHNASASDQETKSGKYRHWRPPHSNHVSMKTREVESGIILGRRILGNWNNMQALVASGFSHAYGYQQ